MFISYNNDNNKIKLILKKIQTIARKYIHRRYRVTSITNIWLPKYINNNNNLDKQTIGKITYYTCEQSRILLEHWNADKTKSKRTIYTTIKLIIYHEIKT